MGNFLGIGSLGLLPYINSLFFIQVLTFISPTIKHLLKDEGELGQKKLKR